MSKNIAKELYPNLKENWGAYDYTPIIEYFGEVLLSEDIGFYQGDTLVLYKHKNGSYSFLTFGWGSCSGCDALQHCGDDYDCVNNLIQTLDTQRVIKNTPKAMLNYFEEKNWENEWFYLESGSKEVIQNMIQILKEELDNE